jgi:hypothetical protein
MVLKSGGSSFGGGGFLFAPSFVKLPLCGSISALNISFHLLSIKKPPFVREVWSFKELTLYAANLPSSERAIIETITRADWRNIWTEF